MAFKFGTSSPHMQACCIMVSSTPSPAEQWQSLRLVEEYLHFSLHNPAELPVEMVQGDIVVDLHEDTPPSEAPARQLRSASERSPSAKAAEGLVWKLLKGQTNALASASEVQLYLQASCTM